MVIKAKTKEDINFSNSGYSPSTEQQWRRLERKLTMRD
jgi:hypothetical protein